MVPTITDQIFIISINQSQLPIHRNYLIAIVKSINNIEPENHKPGLISYANAQSIKYPADC